MRHCVWSRNLKNEEAMTHIGPQRHNEGGGVCLFWYATTISAKVVRVKSCHNTRPLEPQLYSACSDHPAVGGEGIFKLA